MKVTCLIGPHLDPYYSGRVFAGLFEQSKFQVELQVADWIKPGGSIGLEVNGRRIGIELNDRGDRFDDVLLDWCDIYAKRCVSAQPTNDLSSKIVPFGLHCAGRSTRSMLRLFYALKRVLPFSTDKSSLRRYLVSPHWRDFEYRPIEPVNETILFQTRIWDPEEAPGDVVLNDERIQLLLDLQKAFGNRFVGGLVPNAYALENYPSLISKHPHRQPEYIQWAKQSAVGIYSRGLYDSIAFKMAEFMASSKAIVTEPINNRLTAPLDHALVFRSSEECIAHCQNLLSNPPLVRQLREQSWDYYENYVQPSALIRRLLEFGN